MILMERKGNPESHPGVLQEKNKGRCWMQDFFYCKGREGPTAPGHRRQRQAGCPSGELLPQPWGRENPGDGGAAQFPTLGKRRPNKKRRKKKGEFLEGFRLHGQR